MRLELAEEEALGRIAGAPAGAGVLLAVCRRPADGERELLDHGRLSAGAGLVGDNWATRPSPATADGEPDPDAQVTVMSARAAALVSGSWDPRDWAPTGDQLYIDLDLSEGSIDPGALLEVGAAVLEVTAKPHRGCGKFVRRFGPEAMKLVNSPRGRAARLRGVNTRVVRDGAVAPGDRVRVVDRRLAD